MKSVTTSLKVFGIYMILIPGLGLMIFPGLLLDLLNLGHGEHLWMARMIGVLAFIIGVFDILFAKFEFHQVYKTTVLLRYFAALFMIGLWLTGEVEVTILLFALIDIIGATWTWSCIKAPA